MMRPWDERWERKRTTAVPPADPWLIRQSTLLSCGTALDLACGSGRNSLFLAERGYRVLALDRSPVALEILATTATARGLKIEPLCHNLEQGLPAAAQQFDLILCCYYLQRDLFPAIQSQLRPGGLFIGRSFCQGDSAAVPSDIAYRPHELADLFAGWEILDYEEGVSPSPRGGTLGGICARRPQISATSA